VVEAARLPTGQAGLPDGQDCGMMKSVKIPNLFRDFFCNIWMPGS